MSRFAIIEVEDGLTVIPVRPGESPEDAAISGGGVLADTELYASYEDAYDALCELEGELEDEEAER